MDYRESDNRRAMVKEEAKKELLTATHPGQVLENEPDSWIWRQAPSLKRNPMVCSWDLADAQQKLCCLELHSSESVEQEHAKAQMECLELKQEEEDWLHKEETLWQQEMNPEEVCSNKDVFNKSVINTIKRGSVEDEDGNKTFIQKYEQQIQHFGMLSRWDDSLRFLSEFPDLICEETASYLAQWCLQLECEQKTALMNHVAHQVIVMQLIIEMARSCGESPRSCFRTFFQKAKTGAGYTEAFKCELEAFRAKIKQLSRKSSSDCNTAHILECASKVDDYNQQHDLAAASLCMRSMEGIQDEINEEPCMDML
ncbi:hsp90 co-chaperone Cdc37-like 1 isoform X1 [Protopterus annectens]|uniref:hsp90 co-chaperone Cdc37-like 1 isoform X1 n=1 Tax=Protopterus annectens TaxID=7888 RepID=UPI001CFAD29B|nr:hsp90 co-chaperone Cdc37-like 1 isoform X1 [Protopterus annectens]